MAHWIPIEIMGDLPRQGQDKLSLAGFCSFDPDFTSSGLLRQLGPSFPLSNIFGYSDAYGTVHRFTSYHSVEIYGPQYLF